MEHALRHGTLRGIFESINPFEPRYIFIFIIYQELDATSPAPPSATLIKDTVIIYFCNGISSPFPTTFFVVAAPTHPRTNEQASQQQLSEIREMMKDPPFARLKWGMWMVMMIIVSGLLVAITRNDHSAVQLETHVVALVILPSPPSLYEPFEGKIRGAYFTTMPFWYWWADTRTPSIIENLLQWQTCLQEKDSEPTTGPSKHHRQ